MHRSATPKLGTSVDEGSPVCDPPTDADHADGQKARDDASAELEHESVAPPVMACAVCHVTFKHKRSLQRHLARGKHRTPHRTARRKPSRDDDDEDSRDSHKDLNSSDVKLYECPECASVFLEQRGLVNHIKLGIHTECRVCHKVFGDALELRAHMPQHRGEELMASDDDDAATRSDTSQHASDGKSNEEEDEEEDVAGTEEDVEEDVAELSQKVEALVEKEMDRLEQKEEEEAELAELPDAIIIEPEARTDCVSPGELLEWIVQAKERIEGPTDTAQPHSSQQPHQNFTF
jgi:hypothetical protein